MPSNHWPRFQVYTTFDQKRFRGVPTPGWWAGGGVGTRLPILHDLWLQCRIGVMKKLLLDLLQEKYGLSSAELAPGESTELIVPRDGVGGGVLTIQPEVVTEEVVSTLADSFDTYPILRVNPWHLSELLSTVDELQNRMGELFPSAGAVIVVDVDYDAAWWFEDRGGVDYVSGEAASLDSLGNVGGATIIVIPESMLEA